MAIFRMSLPGIFTEGSTAQFGEFLEIAFGAPNFAISGTKLRLFDSMNKTSSVLTGSGFQAVFDGTEARITGGTINTIAAKYQGDPLLSVTGLNLSAKAIFDAVAADDTETFYKLILGGNDQVFGTTASDALFGLDGADSLNGLANNDSMFGGDGNDHLFGGVGLDILVGDTGNDSLFGGKGADTLVGSAGVDQVTGGAGADWFMFNAKANAADIDLITDFQHGVDDVVLQAGDFGAAGPVGNLATNRFFKGAAAHDADDRIIYNPTTGALIYDTNGNAAGGAQRIATLDAGLNLTASDIVIGGFA